MPRAGWCALRFARDGEAANGARHARLDDSRLGLAAQAGGFQIDETGDGPERREDDGGEHKSHQRAHGYVIPFVARMRRALSLKICRF